MKVPMEVVGRTSGGGACRRGLPPYSASGSRSGWWGHADTEHQLFLMRHAPTCLMVSFEGVHALHSGRFPDVGQAKRPDRPARCNRSAEPQPPGSCNKPPDRTSTRARRVSTGQPNAHCGAWLFVSIRKPVPSKYTTLILVRLRLVKTKSAPPRTSSLSRSQTAACTRSNPLRMSTASRQRKTFRLPVKLSMASRRWI